MAEKNAVELHKIESVKETSEFSSDISTARENCFFEELKAEQARELAIA